MKIMVQTDSQSYDCAAARDTANASTVERICSSVCADVIKTEAVPLFLPLPDAKSVISTQPSPSALPMQTVLFILSQQESNNAPQNIKILSHHVKMGGDLHKIQSK